MFVHAHHELLKTSSSLLRLLLRNRTCFQTQNLCFNYNNRRKKAGCGYKWSTFSNFELYGWSPLHINTEWGEMFLNSSTWTYIGDMVGLMNRCPDRDLNGLSDQQYGNNCVVQTSKTFVLQFWWTAFLFLLVCYCTNYPIGVSLHWTHTVCECSLLITLTSISW